MPAQLTRVSALSLPADQRTCAICQENLGGHGNGEPVKTECNHVFDRECIQHWLDGDHSTCPVCREEIRQGPGGGLRDRLRDISRSVRRARERVAEEREQMQQAQADYGGANPYNDNDSENDSPVWEEYEPLSLASPGNFNTPRNRNPSQPRMRSPLRNYSPPPRTRHSSRTRNHSTATGIPADMQRAQSNYIRALTTLSDLDQRIFTQAQVSHRANMAHHDAESNIQHAFARLVAATQSHDGYEIEHALAMQDSVTPLLDQAWGALQYQGAILAELVEESERLDGILTRARETFARERQAFMEEIREGMSGGDEGSGWGEGGRHQQEYRGY